MTLDEVATAKAALEAGGVRITQRAASAYARGEAQAGMAAAQAQLAILVGEEAEQAVPGV